MNRCRVCDHPRRTEIDEAIAEGRSLRDIAATFGGVSKDAVRRHKEAHVSPALVRLGQRLATAQEDRRAESILDRMEALYARVEGLLDRAESEGRDGTFLQASRELRATGELLAKMTGELRDAPQQVTNVLIAPEWLRVRGAILEALLPFPDARDAVVGRLEALETG